jgi:hypothetical protein
VITVGLHKKEGVGTRAPSALPSRVALTYLIDRGGAKRYALAIALFILAGALVECLWMGVLFCLGAWLFCRKANLARLVLWILGTLSLKFINGNTWALAALPIIVVEFWHALDCGNGEDCADG